MQRPPWGSWGDLLTIQMLTDRMSALLRNMAQNSKEQTDQTENTNENIPDNFKRYQGLCLEAPPDPGDPEVIDVTD